VLAVAAALGIMLYYAVQALPGGPQNSPGARVEPPAGRNAPQNLPPRQERPENDRGSGFRPRAILGVSSKIILFSVLVTISILAKNFIFERKSKGKNPPD
jgi:hypothetical protein